MNGKNKNEKPKSKYQPYDPYDNPYPNYMEYQDIAQSHGMPQPQFHYQQHQRQQQMTLQDKDLIQEVFYYMNTAYTRCIKACIEVYDCRKMEKDIIRTALLKLNGLIDNASMQFTEGAEMFPKQHKQVLLEKLGSMQKDFKYFVHQAPLETEFAEKKEVVNDLKFCFERLYKVLNLEPVSFTPVSRKEVDPSVLLDPLRVYYAELDKSEKDLTALKESHKIDTEQPESSWK